MAERGVKERKEENTKEDETNLKEKIEKIDKEKIDLLNKIKENEQILSEKEKEIKELNDIINDNKNKKYELYKKLDEEKQSVLYLQQYLKKIKKNELLQRKLYIYARIKNESIKGDKYKLEIIDDNTIKIPGKQRTNLSNNIIEYNNDIFKFDEVFGEERNQNYIYNEFISKVEKVFNGENIVFFVYGQTGAGKTYTMIGNLNDTNTWGIIPNSINTIFKVNDQIHKNYDIYIKIFEIYNNQIIDPINNLRNSLHSIKEIKYENINDFITLLIKVNNNIKTSNNSINKTSSRSHLLFKVTLKNNGNVVSKLLLIDLAGSEKPDQKNEKNDKLFKEATNINNSLVSLRALFGDVLVMVDLY